MRKPLFETVSNYAEMDYARFHMPGHKGNSTNMCFSDLARYDITEVQGADSLFQASGPILELEQLFATAYGAASSFLSAGGATLCIQGMLAAFCPPGAKVLMGRNLHRTAVNTAALLDLDVEWLYPRPAAGGWFPGRYEAEDLRCALEKYPDVQAVYLTSPDYYGQVSDLAQLSAVCSSYQVPLLVDNAHGAHLRFVREAVHPISCGAAACCDSLHKSLPAMTGGAVLHIREKGRCIHPKSAMALFGSTSPSYPIMLSCESALEYAINHFAADYPAVARQLKQLSALAAEKGIATAQGTLDPLKLTLGFAAAGWAADEFGAYLRQYGIEPEYIGTSACVLMATAHNRQCDFERLHAAISAFVPKDQVSAPTIAHICPERVMPIRKAVFASQQTVKTAEAQGKTAACDISLCPPGIPVIMPGEIISRDCIQLLLENGYDRIQVVSGGSY